MGNAAMAIELADIDKKVVFYAAFKEIIGNANGDFIAAELYGQYMITVAEMRL